MKLSLIHIFVGYITRGRGLTIHRRDCDNLRQLIATEPARLMEVAWAEASPEDAYPVDLIIVAADRKGLLRDISAVFSEADLTLLGVNTSTDRTSDNILKPILRGQGISVPMPVIFIGAIGGFIGQGIIGLFVGAVVLVLGYELLLAWLSEERPEAATGTDLKAGAEPESKADALIPQGAQPDRALRN